MYEDSDLIKNIKTWTQREIEALKSKLEEILMKTEEQRAFEARFNLLLEDLEHWDREDINYLKPILEELYELLKLKTKR